MHAGSRTGPVRQRRCAALSRCADHADHAVHAVHHLAVSPRPRERPNETGCVVAYRTHGAGEPVDPDRWAPPSGRETVCVDPAALDTAAAPPAPHRLSRAYYATWPELGIVTRGLEGVTTPFVVVRDFHAARCVRGPGGYAYLEASSEPMAGDARTSPVDLRDRRFRIGKLGLHVLDMQLAQGDLV